MKALEQQIKIPVQFHVICYETGVSKYETVIMNIPFDVARDLSKVSFQTELEHIDQYIEELDKSEMMYEHNWASIINWDFITNEESVKIFFVTHFSDNPKFLADVDVAYSYLKEKIEHLSYIEQVEIITRAVGLGYAGIETTINKIAEILKPSFELVEAKERYYDTKERREKEIEENNMIYKA